MKYVQLGETSLNVSEISIGTEHLGRCSQKKLILYLNMLLSVASIILIS